MSSPSPDRDPAPSVPLNRPTGGLSQSKPPLWPINASVDNQLIPQAAKCAKPTRPDGICCKELKDPNDQTLIDPDVVRDVIIGLSDGLTVPFALTAGLSSLGESNLVVLGGLAELFAGSISMGIGGFLASQSERDHYRFLRKQTAARVRRSCIEELEREVSQILAPLGVDDQACNQVAKSLADVELSSHTASDSSTSTSSDVESATPLRWSMDVGMTPFLLKFGDGLEEVPTKRLFISAFTIGMGYFIGGLIPLLPYFFIPIARTALIWSVVITGIILLIFGAIKARVTGAAAGKGVPGYVWSSVSTLLVGGVAAGAAFGIVRLLET
ncbi:DUF125-domain-containing protein [Fistulina hepatica ATCC 64428]|uniref:DUF125-domain-containing protein n=1 Tax=Fistulina hepatica ATCC 64428 TaxID=1128425 RepID=A0A0D7AEB4_9AGAR|nr:DUF125-domain-containing protein [Fistulina hepatica ATCC 64428]